MNQKINVNKKGIVYILCLPLRKTGGLELLHQLCEALNKINIYSVMCYTGEKIDNPVNSDYNQYNTPYCFFSDVIQSRNNYIIVPEVFFKKSLLDGLNINIIPWWLSVDNYELPPLRVLIHKEENVKIILRKMKCSLLGDSDILSPKQLSRFPIHLSQSYYANIFLRKKHICKQPLMLSDYINDEFLSYDHDIKHKKNIVIYNPNKGYKFTKLLIDAYPNITFVPIKDLNRKEVISLMLEAKIYIDFGNHPGKDRIPREAAAMGCIVITNRKGSANNKIDVPIPRIYKIPDNKIFVNKIGKKINYCFAHYNDLIDDFKDYRDSIKNEKQSFLETVTNIFVAEP